MPSNNLKIRADLNINWHLRSKHFSNIILIETINFNYVLTFR